MTNAVEYSCQFSESLVAYLYGEIGSGDSRAFEAHLGSCSVCTREFNEFTGVRDAVGLWRDQILAVSPAGATKQIETRPVQVATRSAVAAFREFFSLSPMWLRGATAMCSLAVVALIAFTLWKAAPVNQPLTGPIASASPNVSNPSATTANQNADAPSSRITSNGNVESAKDDQSAIAVPSAIAHAASNQNRKRAPRRVVPQQNNYNAGEFAALNQDKNGEILSDLGLVSRDEDAKPRLSDLIVEPETNN